MEEKLKQDLKQAQFNRDELKVSTLRLLLSEITNVRIRLGEGFGEQAILTVIQKEVKKRKESAEAFRGGNREELAQKEDSERQVLEQYLPAQLSQEELGLMVDEAVSLTGASSLSDMGKVIGLVMGKAQGRADGGQVSQLVKDKLSS